MPQAQRLKNLQALLGILDQWMVGARAEVCHAAQSARQSHFTNCNGLENL